MSYEQPNAAEQFRPNEGESRPKIEQQADKLLMAHQVYPGKTALFANNLYTELVEQRGMELPKEDFVRSLRSYAEILVQDTQLSREERKQKFRDFVDDLSTRSELPVDILASDMEAERTTDEEKLRVSNILQQLWSHEITNMHETKYRVLIHELYTSLEVPDYVREEAFRESLEETLEYWRERNEWEYTPEVTEEILSTYDSASAEVSPEIDASVQEPVNVERPVERRLELKAGLLQKQLYNDLRLFYDEKTGFEFATLAEELDEAEFVREYKNAKERGVSDANFKQQKLGEIFMDKFDEFRFAWNNMDNEEFSQNMLNNGYVDKFYDQLQALDAKSFDYLVNPEATNTHKFNYLLERYKANRMQEKDYQRLGQILTELKYDLANS